MAKKRIIIFLLVGGILVFGIAALVNMAEKAGRHMGESIEKEKISEQKRKDSLQQIQDSLQQYLSLSDSLLKNRRYDSALKLCDLALGIDGKSAQAYLQKGAIYRLEKKYPQAMDQYSSAIGLNNSLGQAWYERALCYVKQKKKREAVNDLLTAIKLNYHGADSVYEKINPLKKRIVGSHCRCCDGSISYSSGRGTCSHHGGVCSTEYDYETYRDY